MPPVMPPRFFRPRLLLLPLVLGVLVAPVFLTKGTPDPAAEVHAGALCSNDTRIEKAIVPRNTPTCVNCRAPLLNAPLASAHPGAAPISVVALPPAA